jgi:hypothetical protein
MTNQFTLYSKIIIQQKYIFVWANKLLVVSKQRKVVKLGVRANVQPKSSIPIGGKVEISPNGFTLGVKAELEKSAPSY